MERLIPLVRHTARALGHHAEHLLHPVYFGLVAYESHHFYSYVAAGLLVSVVLSAVGGGEA